VGVRYLEETKQQAVDNLLCFAEIMQSNDVPFCLMEGTLLGAYRDKDFVKYDYDDVDLGILHQDWPFTVSGKVLLQFAGAGFTVVKAFTHEGLLEGICLSRGNNHIDIMRVHVVGGAAYNLARCRFLDLPLVIAYEYPAECFTSFDMIEFLERDFCIPHNTEEALVARFLDWQRPVRRENYNYLDPKQVPCIRATWPKETT